MTKVIKFSITGSPQAQKRVRVTRFATYDPSADAKKDFLILAYEHRPKSIILGAVALRVRFVMPRPKNHYGTGKNVGMLKGNAPRKHTKRPDADNMLKFIKDALSKVYWKDDSQVWFEVVTKIYGENPSIDVRIEYED